MPDELAALETLGYDLAGSYLLGRDVATITPAEQCTRLRDILTNEILVPPDYVNLVRVLQGGEAIISRAVGQFQAFRAELTT